MNPKDGVTPGDIIEACFTGKGVETFLVLSRDGDYVWLKRLGNPRPITMKIVPKPKGFRNLSEKER